MFICMTAKKKKGAHQETEILRLCCIKNCCRFTRSAGLVASGVAKNANKVGNHIKETIDDILYPYRKRSK